MVEYPAKARPGDHGRATAVRNEHASQAHGCDRVDRPLRDDVNRPCRPTSRRFPGRIMAGDWGEIVGIRAIGDGRFAARNGLDWKGGGKVWMVGHRAHGGPVRPRLPPARRGESPCDI